MKNIFRKMSLRGKLALLFCLAFLLMALFSSVLAKHPYNEISGRKFEPPGAEHWLGTDNLGMDIWSQLCHGARISLSLGITVAFIASFVGGLVGLAAAFCSPRADRLLMTVCDLFLSVPDVPVIIILSSFFGQRVSVMILALCLFSWTNPARIIRSRSLALKELDYVRLSRSYGASFFHLFREHLFREIWPLWLSAFVQLTGRAVVMESAMAFLGLGDPTSKSWGMILNGALNYRGIYYTDSWKWWIIPPVLSIALLVSSLAALVSETEKLTNMKGARQGWNRS
ncbi:MAG: ABC transporter permease [Clostridiales bacterium]|nr:ABC transporter permease [Candidatus Apopatocola equi]